jgi:hypothetical protein
MGRARLLWLLLPIAGLLELASFVHDARKAPRVEEWQALRAEVARLKGPTDLVVVAPEWADPIARLAFGDALMPIADLARPDVSAYARAVEVDALGASSAELEGWSVRQVLHVGRFELRVRENPKPAQVLFSFVEQAHPPSLNVDFASAAEGGECPFTRRARFSAGGLHGHLGFPRERYECGSREDYFVGVTILDDQAYRPRRCIWAQAAGQHVNLRYAAVPIGRKIYGYSGLSYFLNRDGRQGPVTLSARVAGEEVGRSELHHDGSWLPFEFDTTRFAGQTAAVEFVVTHEGYDEHQFCFYADTR